MMTQSFKSPPSHFVHFYPNMAHCAQSTYIGTKGFYFFYEKVEEISDHILDEIEVDDFFPLMNHTSDHHHLNLLCFSNTFFNLLQ